MEKPQSQEEKIYIAGVYSRIISLATLSHLSHVVIFALLSYPILAVYNLGSTVFYILILRVVKREHYRCAVTVIHLEVTLFVLIGTAMAGWELGLYLYLVAISALVYFCPYDHKFVPYLLSILEILILLGLKIYTASHLPYYPPLPKGLETLIYCYSLIACFAIILYAAFVSNLSAMVTNSALQAENQKMCDLANHDQLTGLYSRLHLQNRLSELEGEWVVLAMGDIDDFKQVNDTYGHSCGDYILHTTAGLMGAYCDSRTEICRWGGEEFLTLFHNTDPQEARRQIQRLCDAIYEHEFIYGGNVIHVTFTFGICAGVLAGNAAQLIDCADRLLYAGKRAGKNRVVWAENDSDFSN